MEAIGSILSFIATYFAAKENVLTWPLSVIAMAIYILIFVKVKLYADVLLHIIYLGMYVYGLVEWLKKADGKQTFHPRYMRFRNFFLIMSVGVLIALLSMPVAVYFNDSMPYLDTIATVFALISTWMTAKKYIETWIVWWGLDVLYIYMYVSKGLYMTSLLHVTYLCLAIFGLYKWHRAYKFAKLAASAESDSDTINFNNHIVMETIDE
ncbi:MAG: nicotinamide mononucleotide transporter [Alcanivoracaceae bacterium]|nr:nicotinamide mononucleotide transporter [Alcanivoracaceae bacterium]